MRKFSALITEDDRFLADAYAQEFKEHGFSSTIVADGIEALDFVKKNRPDIIILDLVMPRKNGVQVLEDLYNEGVTKKIPVIVVTNLENAGIEKKCLTLGAKKVVLKSTIVLADLVVMCKEYLAKKPRKKPVQKKKA